MFLDDFRNLCLSFDGVEEDTPFGPDTLVFKVYGKMFALCSLADFDSINVKCDPEIAVELRDRYEQVNAGYHMNKKHWNTITLEGLSRSFVEEQIRNSYKLVYDSLPKKSKQ